MTKFSKEIKEDSEESSDAYQAFDNGWVEAKEDFAKVPPRKWLIMPDNEWKTKWDSYIVVVLIWVSITLPYQIAFHEETSKKWFVIGLIVDLSFLVDIILTFFSAIHDYKNRTMITDRKQIALKYLKSWLIIDVISITPFDLFFKGNSAVMLDAAKFGRFARLSRMARLLRIARMSKLFRLLKDR